MMVYNLLEGLTMHFYSPRESHCVSGLLDTDAVSTDRDMYRFDDG